MYNCVSTPYYLQSRRRSVCFVKTGLTETAVIRDLDPKLLSEGQKVLVLARAPCAYFLGPLELDGDLKRRERRSDPWSSMVVAVVATFSYNGGW